MKYRKDYSLYRRKKKNKEFVWYYRTYDEYGQRTVARSTGCTNRTLAERYCNNLLKSGELVPTKETRFAEYAAPWWIWGRCPYIKGRLARSPTAKPAISQRHARDMRSALEGHILPEFKNYRLAAITPQVIERWMFSLLDSGLSAKRANNIVSCLRVMLTEARRLGLLQRNPFEAVRPFADNCRERGVLSIDEVKTLFDTRSISTLWEGHLLHRLINEVAAASGMRQGEILAIRVEDVRNGYLHVAHSWHPQYGLGPTKTKQVRDVPIPSRVLGDMSFFIDAAAGPGPGGGFVFSFDRGKSPASGARTTGALYGALEKIGITEEERKRRNITFHGWRHWFNSVMRSRSVPTPILQKVTGHTTTEMTERYSHFSLADFVAVINVQAEVFK